jgi:hypothetical protein
MEQESLGWYARRNNITIEKIQIAEIQGKQGLLELRRLKEKTIETFIRNIRQTSEPLGPDTLSALSSVGDYKPRFNSQYDINGGQE